MSFAAGAFSCAPGGEVAAAMNVSAGLGLGKQALQGMEQAWGLAPCGGRGPPRHEVLSNSSFDTGNR